MFVCPGAFVKPNRISTGTHMTEMPSHWKSTLQPIKSRLSFCIHSPYHLLPHIRKLVRHIEFLLLAIEFPELPKHP